MPEGLQGKIALVTSASRGIGAAIAERFAAEHGIDLAKSYFYTDSYSDLPMLLKVGGPRAVNPDRRLRRHAQRAGWPILAW